MPAANLYLEGDIPDRTDVVDSVRISAILRYRRGETDQAPHAAYNPFRPGRA